jgi:hypothetical protein
VTLRFHSETLKLLGVTPSISRRAVSELDNVETRIGRKLPASVREWYSLEDACDLLERYSNSDLPIQVSEFGVPREDTHGGGPYDLLSRGLVVFRYENQAVCVWAFRIDGSDDPPVEVDYDSQFEVWTQCAPKFSAHIYAWMWDFALVLMRKMLLQAQNFPLSETALGKLREQFDAGPVTHGWPGHTQYRFSEGDKRILIWASEGQADWWLTADSEDSLRDLIDKVWDIDQVGRSLWSHSECGRSLLPDNG